VSSSAERATVRLADVGAMVALVTCGSVVVYFITRIMHELRERDRRLRIAEQQQQLSRQLESLGTLSAGAAHELATPLSTIALVAKELGIQLNKQSVSQSVLDDIQLVRSEVDHCRSILNRMSGRAGQAVGEELTELTVRQLIETVVSELRQPERVHLRLPFRDEQRSVTLPLQTVAQAVRGVIQNGLDASTEDQKVDVSVQCNDHLHLEIRDHGRGMPAEVLQRAGEPFFTTKQPGNGMGLGLFLTRSVFERLGGSCRIRSIPDQGTTVDLELPFAP
jgi:two-component system sensor histidine kinase RegB